MPEVPLVVRFVVAGSALLIAAGRGVLKDRRCPECRYWWRKSERTVKEELGDRYEYEQLICPKCGDTSGSECLRRVQ